MWDPGRKGEVGEERTGSRIPKVAGNENNYVTFRNIILQ